MPAEPLEPVFFHKGLAPVVLVIGIKPYRGVAVLSCIGQKEIHELVGDALAVQAREHGNPVAHEISPILLHPRDGIVLWLLFLGNYHDADDIAMILHNIEVLLLEVLFKDISRRVLFVPLFIAACGHVLDDRLYQVQHLWQVLGPGL